MARRGAKRRLDLESRYWQLILSEVETVEACQIIGIGRKTGYGWRAESGGLPPTLVAEEARSSRYLSRSERQRIAPCGPRNCPSGRSRDGSAVTLPRSAGSCAATSDRMIRGATTRTWPIPIPGPGNVRVGRARLG
jgi:hypothetical protein